MKKEMLINVLQPEECRIAIVEILQSRRLAAVRDLERLGLEILAIYHSHPTSAPVPSKTDLARNYSAEVMNLIISLQNAEPEVLAWWLTADDFRAAAWDVVDAP